MYLAVDIGGTKTLVAVFDEQGQLKEKTKFSTTNDFSAFLEDFKDAQASLQTSKFDYCGIGMPGVIDREHGVSRWGGGNLGWPKDNPIAEQISAIINCGVVVENDANAAGLSEAVLVKDRYRTALYLTISTGIGGVYVIDGIIDQNTVDAEVGHMIFKSEDGYHTWEQLASGKAIVAKYGQRADEISDAAVWQAATEPLAVGLINLSATLTPEVIILGGGVGAHLDRFQPYLQDWLKQLRPPTAVRVPNIIPAKRAEEAVLYGCYELARQKAGNRGSTD